MVKCNYCEWQGKNFADHVEGLQLACPQYKNILIEREMNKVIKNEVKNGKCAFCNFQISGVWE